MKSVQVQTPGKRIRIGMTSDRHPGSKFANYESWVRRFRQDVEVVRLAEDLANASVVKELDGLILTGGGDVHPASYGKADQIGQTKGVSELRDNFELEVIDQALDRGLPILGICRGTQIMNVYLGGTLVIDLPSEGYQGHGSGGRHQLLPRPDSMVAVLCGPGPLHVNSSHHQAVERPGRALMVGATSDDGVIESLEWILKDRMPFLLLVQWHPERMEDFESPCSGKIGEQFLREVSLFQANKHEHLQSEKETEHENHG